MPNDDVEDLLTQQPQGLTQEERERLLQIADTIDRGELGGSDHWHIDSAWLRNLANRTKEEGR